MEPAASSPAPRARVRRVFDACLILLFVGAIAAPTVDALIRPREERNPVWREFRSATPWPARPANLTMAMRLPRQFEAWFDDTAGLRDHLLWLRGHVLGLGFGVSPTGLVDLAPDGWMFYRGAESREAFCGALPFDDAILGRWEEALRSRREICRTLGAEHLFVIGPNKETIYPERVPRSWHKLGATPFERWRARFAASETPLFLDLVPALSSARAGDRPREGEFLYYPLGTHWMPRGDHLAYARIIEALRVRFPALAPPLPYDELVRVPKTSQVDSWAERAYLEDVFTQPSYGIDPPRPASFPEGTYADGRRRIVAIGPDKSKPRAILFHDSFGQNVCRLLAPHFSRLDCVWSSELDLDLVHREHPDVVIELYVERVIGNIEPNAFKIAADAWTNDPWRNAGAKVFELRRETAVQDVLLGPDIASRLPDYPAGILRLRLERDGGYVILPALRPPPTGELLVRIEIEAPGLTELALQPLRAEDERPAWRDPITAIIGGGLSRLLLRVPADAQVKRFALRPGRIPGRYLIRSFVVREAGK